MALALLSTCQEGLHTPSIHLPLPGVLSSHLGLVWLEQLWCRTPTPVPSACLAVLTVGFSRITSDAQVPVFYPTKTIL